MYNKTIVSLENTKKIKKNTPMSQMMWDVRRLGSISSSLPSNTLPVVYYIDYNL